MRPTSPWSSTRWTCFIAVGSTDSVWFPRTAILPALPPVSGSKASMCSGSANRRRRRASGRPVDRFVYTENLLAGAANTQDAASRSKPLQPPDAATPIIKKVIAQMESEDGWVALGEVGKQLANLASDFDPQNLRLPQAERPGAKDKFFRDRSAQGRLHANSDQAAGRITAEGASRSKTCGVNDRRRSEPRL